MLTVVILSEQNAEVPSTLPSGASSVNSTAQMLAKIARQLCTSNYKNFPAIANEISQASDLVDSATSSMNQSLQQLMGLFYFPFNNNSCLIHKKIFFL